MQDPSDFQRSHYVRHCKHYVSRGFREARRPNSLPSLMLSSGRGAMYLARPRHLYRSDLGPPDFVGVPSRAGRMQRVFHTVLRLQGRDACDTPTRSTVGRWLRREAANIGVRFHFLRPPALRGHDAGISQTERPSLCWMRSISTLVSYIVAPSEVLWRRQPE